MNKLFLLAVFIYGICFGQKGQFELLHHHCTDGVERPFVIYKPKNTDNKNKKPLLVFLHGSVSSPNIKKNPVEYAEKSPLITLADEGNFYLMFSYGQKGATWFDEVGNSMILSEIESIKQKFNIDENKIFLSGFSDGGSGVLYHSMTNPEPFAGFIALNGSLRVADKLGVFDIFPENMNRRPMYIINTKNDMLYPISQMTPTIEYLQKSNPNIIYKALDGNHEMSYLETEKPFILDFIRKNYRLPFSEFYWEFSDDKKNKFNGITATKSNNYTKKNWHLPYSLKILNNKADFGIVFDQNAKELKVESFKNPNSTAEKMGVKKGDIILKMEQDSMKNTYSPYIYLSKKQANDSTSLTINRDGEILELHGKFNAGKEYEVFTNKEPSAKL
ncbi:MAG: phospholipase, partial [Bergeyella zoohelcum]|nr:phospholipase [Bergeyella zoohelcum]